MIATARRRFLTAIALAAIAVGCRKTPEKAGADVAHRIVSVSASTTEALFAIGAGAQVVGRSNFCNYPPEATKLPSVGGFVDPSLETVLALTPDLVVGARGPAGSKFATSLADHGIATWFPETETFEQVFAMLTSLGDRSGHVEEARKLVESLRARRRAIEAALAKSKRPRVLIVFSSKPITAAGPSSFPSEMLIVAGATNALGADAAKYPTLGLEEVARLDPDLILDAEMVPGANDRPSDLLSDSTWKVVRAVREGHVARVADERVLRPGPRILEGAGVVARAVHPEIAIEGIDAVQAGTPAR